VVDLVYGLVDVLLPSAHQLLNWSAFLRILADFGLDPGVVVGDRGRQNTTQVLVSERVITGRYPSRNLQVRAELEMSI